MSYGCLYRFEPDGSIQRCWLLGSFSAWAIVSLAVAVEQWKTVLAADRPSASVRKGEAPLGCEALTG
jgi:hypothetical protein